MSLAARTKLGPYEIQSALGAGGMGEVYRAQDTRLGRTVAIKILPQHLSANPDLKQRFEREARAISSLNHPRICTLHDIGQQDGLDFLVMEYLEGETLAQRLRRGPMPLKEALKLGTEICEALEVAHRSGIIHRDLKPGNIMLTANGLKLMDFGLAKAAAAGLSSGASKAPQRSAVQTMSEASPLSPLTTAGAVIGTIQYMAPEQIEGKDADARSDVFALGAVLYEMITGVKPFDGKSQISVASAILEKDPEPISKRQPLTPPALEHVVNSCLAKSPEDRYQSARDVRLELKWIAEMPPPTPAAPATKSHPQILPWAITAAAVLLCVVGGILVLSRNAPQPHYRMVTFREGTLQNARFSHDGQTIVFSGQWEGADPQVSTTRVGSAESRPLGIPSATLAAVSNNDELALVEGCEPIFILDCGGALATVSLAGGAPREIAAHVAYADWSPDGKQLAIIVNDPNDARLEFPPGHVLYRQSSGWLGHLRFSPDGALIAFENHPEQSDDGTIEVVDVKGQRRVLSQGWLSIEGLAWRPDGKEIWFAGTVNTSGWADGIHAVTLSGKERTLLRFPWVRMLDISSDGHVLLAHQNYRRQMFGLFPGDSAEHPYSWLDDTYPNALSADGRAMTFDESGEVYYIANNGQAYYRKTDGSPAVSLGAGNAYVSPDGQWILMNVDKTMMVQPVGLGAPRELSTPGITAFANPTWSDDGRQIAYEGLFSGKEWNIYLQKIDGGPPTMVAQHGRAAFPVLSPDGSVLAMHDDQGISLYRPGEKQRQALKGALASERPVRFVNGGRALLVSGPSGSAMDFSLIDVASGHRQLWKHLPARVLLNGAGLAATPDLKYYAYGTPHYSTDMYLVENLR